MAYLQVYPKTINLTIDYSHSVELGNFRTNDKPTTQLFHVIQRFAVVALTARIIN